MRMGKNKRGKKEKESNIITCEKVQGGFIFEVSSMQFIPGEKRVIKSEVDAITVFVGLIHGQKLNEIRAHEEEKKND